MKSLHWRTLGPWLASVGAWAGMSACAGPTTPSPQEFDTLAVWSSHTPRTHVETSGDDAPRPSGHAPVDATAAVPLVGPVTADDRDHAEPTRARPDDAATTHAPYGRAPLDPFPDEPSWQAASSQADPTLRPAEIVDEPGQTPQDLWDRLRAGLSMPDIDGPLVRNWERWYAERPDYVQRMATRAGRYLFHITEEVERRGLPSELALLPFIESAFNPQALSVAKASGIWQFMPATGRDFDLTQNLFRDDRRHVLASTRAALTYLQTLHGMFGDWHLALAAYNWGQGNVQRALDRGARETSVRPSYEDLRMPAETRNYVPKLQAIENIIRNPSAFGLTLPALENHPFFLTVPIDRDIDVELAARLAGLDLQDFRALNPQLNKPVILAAGTPEILLPHDHARQFEEAIAAHTGPRASWTAWVAPRTLHPRDAAAQTGQTEARLREVNRIPAGMLIRAGSTLLIPRTHGRQADVSPKIADGARIALAPDASRVQRKVVRARPSGEKLGALARRHGVTPSLVAHWNRLPVEAMLRPGQSVVLLVPRSPPPRPTARPPAASSPAKRPASSTVAQR